MSAEAIDAYILAKDHNRPHLMAQAFCADARLTMLVRTDSIAFPADTAGRDAISELLVRRFNQRYENIHTWCLGPPPLPGATEHGCDWLVLMSEKDGGRVRAGCGRYQWCFDGPGGLVRELHITIEHMHALSPDTLQRLMRVAALLPYPWCGQDQALQALPRLDELAPLRAWLGRGLPAPVL